MLLKKYKAAFLHMPRGFAMVLIMVLLVCAPLFAENEVEKSPVADSVSANHSDVHEEESSSNIFLRFFNNIFTHFLQQIPYFPPISISVQLPVTS